LVTIVLLVGISVACRGKKATPTLEGTLWTLASYVNSQGDLVSVLPNIEVTAEFQDGQVNGNAGCNNYFVSYEAAGEHLTIDLIGATQMFCGEPENVMEQEDEYLAALQSAASYQITNGQLQIANADGETVLTFSVKEPTPLAGTTWQLTFYNNGKGGLVSVLGGTEITAVFGEDGDLTGSAGCNNYTTSYEVAGDQITIGPVATTRMMCAEPEGIMEQERAYLVALESAAIYQIQGDRLEMRDAGGVRVLTFNAVSDAG